jgi:hypothetical protein
MAPAAWTRSADTELAIEIMEELERADLDIEPGSKMNRTIEPKRDHHEYEDPAHHVQGFSSFGDHRWHPGGVKGAFIRIGGLTSGFPSRLVQPDTASEDELGRPRDPRRVSDTAPQP